MRKIILLILSFAFVGCTWIHPFKSKHNVVLKPKFLNEENILFPKSLAEGGILLVLPFKAGNDVVVDDDFDKVSLMIVRGFVDVYQEEPETVKDSKIEVVFSEEKFKAGFILEGEITKIKNPSFWKKLMLNRKNVLTIEGHIKEAKTGRILITFKDKKIASYKKGDHRQLGRLIGQNIARFIFAVEREQRIRANEKGSV